jgi:hypothetical protein
MSGIVVHTCKTSTWKVEAGESQVQGWPGLYTETLPQKKGDKLFLLFSYYESCAINMNKYKILCRNIFSSLQYVLEAEWSGT